MLDAVAERVAAYPSRRGFGVEVGHAPKVLPRLMSRGASPTPPLADEELPRTTDQISIRPLQAKLAKTGDQA